MYLKISNLFKRGELKLIYMTSKCKKGKEIENNDLLKLP